MNTRPSIDDLFEGVTLTLEQVIMPATEDAAAREQEALILNVLRRVAGDWDTLGKSLYDDNRDTEAALQEILLDLRGAGRSDADGAAQHLDAVLAERPYQDCEYITTHTLAGWNVALKAAVVWTIETLQLTPDKPNPLLRSLDGRVRALLHQTLRREIATTPPLPGGAPARGA